MTALTLSTSSAAALRADAVVVGVAKGSKGPVAAPGAEAVDQAFDGKLAATLETRRAPPAPGAAVAYKKKPSHPTHNRRVGCR
ncbi:hypothetical protein ACWGCW_23665, partial [Streptomyces sp. NPDC054933]